MDHKLIISLVIAYTLAGAVVFTVIVTCLSMMGWIRLADARQQNKLFTILIVELVTVSVTFFGGFLNFSPVKVQEHIQNATEDARIDQIAEEAANQFDYWMKHWNHPTGVSNSEELLVWLSADHGALKVGEDYRVFVKMSEVLTKKGYKTSPAPLKFEFDRNVEEHKKVNDAMLGQLKNH